jgi:hypothetical protein
MNRLLILLLSMMLMACNEPVEQANAGSSKNKNDSLAPVPSEQKSPDLKLLSLPVAENSVETTGLEDCSASIQLDVTHILAVCRENERDTQEDYGLRVYLIEKANGKPIVLFRSRGAGDAYVATLAVFGGASATAANIVFVEFAAEFGYGTMVFQRDGGDMKKIGDIDLIAVDEHEELAKTLDVINAVGSYDDFRVVFSGLLTKMQADGTYIDIAGDSVYYTYSDLDWRLHSNN